MKATGPLIVLATSLALLPGCGGSGGGSGSSAPEMEPFLFATSANTPVGIRVLVDGAPWPFAEIQIVDELPLPGFGQTIEDVTRGALYFQGVTDAEGRCDALVPMASAITRLDLIVNVPHAAGDYSVPEHRLMAGPFAPSARVSFAREQLQDVQMELWSQ